MDSPNQQVLRRLEEWKQQLIDPSRRNRLLNFPVGARGTVKLVEPSGPAIYRHLVVRNKPFLFYHQDPLGLPFDFGDDDEDGPATPNRILRADEVRTNLSDSQLKRTVYGLRQKARTSLQEQGVVTLFVAMGILGWFDRTPASAKFQSPLLLIPVELHRDLSEDSYKLTLFEEEVILNPALVCRLASEQVRLPELPKIDCLNPPEYFAAVLSTVQSRGWWVHEDAYLGLFSFLKVTMYEDLNAHVERALKHPLVRALAGDASGLVIPDGLPDGSSLDAAISVEDTFQILDADSSQQEAIQAAKCGASFVLQGPPGTGKSQTIANIIAECLAQGKKVLFVSEKMAALEVVHRRLTRNGLGDFCLQAHSHKANKRQVIEELGRVLSANLACVRRPSLELAELASTRASLNGYIFALHSPRGGLGLSAFQAHAQLAALAHATDVTFTLDGVLGTQASRLAAINEFLSRLAQLHDVITHHEQHPWRHTRLSQTSLQLESEIAERFAKLRDLLRNLESAACDLAEACQLEKPCTREDIDRLINILGLLQTTPRPPHAWFQLKDVRPLLETAQRLKSACQEYHSRRGGLLSAFDQRLLRADLDALEAHLAGSNTALLQRMAASDEEPADVVVALRTQLGSVVSAIVHLLDRAHEAGARLASACGVPAPSTLAGARSVGTLADLIIERAGTDPASPAAWLRSASVGTLVEEVHRLKAHCGNYLARRAGLLAGFDERLLGANLESLEAQLTTAHVDLLQRLSCPGQAADRAVALRSELGHTLAHAARTLQQVSHTAASLASACGVAAPDTVAGAKSLCSIADLMTQDPRPERHWFGNGQLAVLKAAADEAQQRYAQYQHGRSKLGEHYDDSYMSLDHVALVERFSNQYATVLRFLQSGYYQDMRGIRAARLHAGKVAHTDLLSDLRLGRVTAESKGWIEAHQADNLRDFRRQYNGIDTDWGAVARALECCRRIAERMPGGEMPAGLVEVLLQSGNAIESVSRHRGALQACMREFEDALEAVRRMLAVEPLPFRAGDLRDATIDSLRGWFSDLHEHLIGFLTAYDTVAGYAKGAGAGAPVATLVAAVREARGLNQAEAEFQGMESQLRRTYGDLFSGMETDWERVMSGLHWTGRVLAWFGPLEVSTGFLAALDTDAELVSRERAIVGTCLTELESQFAALCKMMQVEPLPFTTHDLDGAPIIALRTWFAELQQHLADFLAAYDTAAGYAIGNVTGAPIAALIAAIREARCLRQVETEFQGRDTQLRQDYGHLYEGVGTDWEQVLAALGWTEDVLAWFGAGNISEGFASIACGNISVSALNTRLMSLQDIHGRTAAEWAFVTQIFDTGSCTAGDVTLEQASISSLQSWLQRRLDQLSDLSRWIAFRHLPEQARAVGLEGFLTAVMCDPPPAGAIRDAFYKRFWILWLDAACQECSRLAAFDGRTQDAVVERFRCLDRMQFSSARERLRAHLSAQKPTSTEGSRADGELAVLRRETGKRRHKPLRQLFAEAPHVVQALKPCMLMSPLSVAQFLNPERMQFNVVLFDEASQICPEDAIGAIMRAEQVIIVGDDKQLPPTRFFAAGSSAADESDEGAENAMEPACESILEECAAAGLPQRKLLWHYRSRSESLIAFSNHRYYKGELVTFPDPSVAGAPQGSPSLSFVYVDSGVYVRGGKGASRPKDAGTNRIEARRVAELVLDHFDRYPKETLGVIAFSEAQQQAIDEALLALRHSSSKYEEFFDEDRPEPFFVKNLENVQGDERDCIIFSVGYGRDASGSLSMNFGPLNKKGGERRLNVAITRARSQVTLVSSIQPYEIDLSRTGSEGVADLRAYMEFAKKGNIALQARENGKDEDREDLFASEVCIALAAAGLVAHLDVGCSESKVDIAIVDEDNPSRYVLGVLCDGSACAALKTARDRHRLRQEVLETLGWPVIQLWSADWVQHRQREVERLLQAVAWARQEAGRGAADCQASEEATLEAQRHGPLDLPNAASQNKPEGELRTEWEDEGRRLLLPTYRPYSVPQLGSPDDFYWAAESNSCPIVELLIQVVAHEGPVHLLEATRRVASGWGIGRAGSRVVGVVNECVDRAVSSMSISRRGEFLWPDGDFQTQARVPSPGREARKVEVVALEEIAEAALICTRDAFGIERTSLVTSTARLLGYDRTGAHVRDRISEAIDLLVMQGRVKERGDSITVAEA